MKICLQCKSPVRKSWVCSSCDWHPHFVNGFPLFAPDLIDGGGVSYLEDSHDHLSALEETNFWFVSRNRLLCYLLEKHFPHAAKMLEIGCGNGFVLSGMAECRPAMKLYGSEAYLSGLMHAKKRLPCAWLAQMDARRIPFESEFDVIGAFDVIEHIEEDRMVLEQMYQALNPGGGIIITVPQHTWLWSEVDDKAGHKRRYARQDLIEKITDAGFTKVTTTSFIGLLLPFMMASRLMGNSNRNKSPQKNAKATAGLNLSGGINRVFMKICDIERSMIKSGVTIPWGGSLVCVAKKMK